MRRWFFFVYGVVGHLLFLAIFAYMACFVADIRIAKSIDTPSNEPLAIAVLIDLLLLASFGVQHSVMARPAFKRLWTRIVPEPIERSTYVWASLAVTALLMWQWRGIDLTVWSVQQPTLRVALWILFAIGWLLVPVASLLINHFDLFGTRQVWLHLHGREYQSLPFRTPSLYKRVRHPLYIGWAIAFWATPTMTLGHLLFAAVLTGYMALAALFEERDLVAHFGDEYRNYQRNVPRYIPRWNTAASEPRAATSEATAS